MSTTAFTVDRFGGLNVADDPVTVGATGATFINNVDIDVSGRIRCRAGYSVQKALTVDTAGGLAAYETTSGTAQFVVGSTTGGTRSYAAYASTGGAAVSTATPGSTVVNAVRWGDPTNEYLYIANGTDTIWRWTGAAFSQPAGMPTATFLGVSPYSNRLVTANLSGLPSRVLFSDAGAPETFTYNTAPTPDTGNYVDLTPGDGSPITGVATWQNYIFVFKKDRFFVFTGESTDSDGQPVFNYRTVDTFGSLIPPVAGDEGVYFFDGRSIWVTTGGPPTRVSREIEPVLRGIATSSALTPVDQTLLSSVRIFYSLGRLFLVFPSSIVTASSLLIFDSKVSAWTVYGMPVEAKWLTTLRTSGSDAKFTHFFGGGSAGVCKFNPALTQDNGSGIGWSWTSGWSDLGEPGRVKVTLESRVWGIGLLLMGVANDYAAADGPGVLTLGTSPAVADAWQQMDREGTLWQTVMSGTTGGVDRLIHYVSFVKPSGIQ